MSGSHDAVPAVKTNEGTTNATSSIPRMIVVATTMCLLAPLLVAFNSRSAFIAEQHILVGSEQQKNSSSNQSLAARLFDPIVFQQNNETMNNNDTHQHVVNDSNTLIATPDLQDSQEATTLTPIHNNDKHQIVIELNNTFFYWRETQHRFCDFLRHVTNVSNLGVDPPYHIRHHQSPPRLRSTFDCQRITTDNDLGTGNWITGFYAMRIAAALAMVDFDIHCHGGLQDDLVHLISWFTGNFSAPAKFKTWPYDPPTPQQSIACHNRYPRLHIEHMTHQMQSDVRRLAVTVLGSRPEWGWTHPLVPEDHLPLVPNVTLDEAVIHFRCGDILGGVNRQDFGIIHFSEYLKWISNTTLTLGIVTQPFTKGKYTRTADDNKGKQCRQVVIALANYIHTALPNITIRVHNDPNEPLAVAYARMVMSKQAFVSYSSFGIFPVVGTFGDGYFQRGNRGVNPWAANVPRHLPNVHMMDAPSMSSQDIKRAGLEATLQWLVSPINETSARV